MSIFGSGKRKISLGGSRSQDNDDFDFDMDGENLDQFEDEHQPDKGRKPSLFNYVKRHVTTKVNDRNEQQRLLKTVLPSSYSGAVDLGLDVKDDIDQIKYQLQKEWGAIKTPMKKILKSSDGALRKLKMNRLADWAGEDERRSTYQDEEVDQTEALVQSMMSEFTSSLGGNKPSTGKDDSDDTEKMENDKFRSQSLSMQIRGVAGTQASAGLLNRLVNYQDQITFNFQKKSIELGVRTYLEIKKQRELFETYKGESVTELKEIHKNTGLPEAVKINQNEMASQIFKEKMIGRVAGWFDQKTNTLRKRVMSRIRDRMTEMAKDLGSSLTSFSEMMEEDAESGGKGGVLGLGGRILGDSFIDKVYDKTLKRPANWIKNKLTSNSKINRMGLRLNAFSKNAGGMLNNALLDGSTGNGLLDGVIDTLGLRQAAVTRQDTIRQSLSKNLDVAQYMDVKFKQSVERVIPGWLSLIHKENVLIRKGLTDDKGQETKHWDWDKEEFVTTKSLEEDLTAKIVNKDNVKDYSKSMERLLRHYGSWMLDAKTKEKLKEWVYDRIRSSKSATLYNLLLDIDRNFKGKEKEAITIMCEYSGDIYQEDLESINQGFMTEFNLLGREKYARWTSTYANLVQEVAGKKLINWDEIQELAQQGHDKILENMGYLKRNSDGSLDRNMDYEKEFLNKFTKIEHQQAGKLKEGDTKEFTSPDGRRQSRRTWEIDEAASPNLEDHLQEDPKLELAAFRLLQSILSQDVLDERRGRDNKSKLSSQISNILKMTHTEVNDRDLFNENNRASGGLINTYAKGGKVRNYAKGGATGDEIPVDEEVKATLHGGEFVTDKTTTQKNKKLLEFMNKFKASVIMPDGTVNPVYYKAFGFTKEEDFKNAHKNLELPGDQRKIAIDARQQGSMEYLTALFTQIDLSKVTDTQLKFISDPSVPAFKKLQVLVKLKEKQNKKTGRDHLKEGVSKLTNHLVGEDGKLKSPDLGDLGDKTKKWREDSSKLFKEMTSGLKEASEEKQKAVLEDMLKDSPSEWFSAEEAGRLKNPTVSTLDKIYLVTRVNLREGNRSEILGKFIRKYGKQGLNEIKSKAKNFINGSETDTTNTDNLGKIKNAVKETAKEKASNAKRKLKTKAIMVRGFDYNTMDSYFINTLLGSTGKTQEDLVKFVAQNIKANYGFDITTEAGVEALNKEHPEIVSALEQFTEGAESSDIGKVNLDVLKKVFGETQGNKIYDEAKRTSSKVSLYLGKDGKNGKPVIDGTRLAAGEYHVMVNGMKAPYKSLSIPFTTLFDTKSGEVVLTLEDIVEQGLYTRMGTQMTPAWVNDLDAISLNSLDSTAGNIWDEIKNSSLLNKAMTKLRLQKAKDIATRLWKDQPVDVYLVGSPEAPRLTAAGFAEGLYIDRLTGRVCASHHDITGPVANRNNEVLLNAQDIDKGLCDKEGKLLEFSSLKRLRNVGKDHLKRNYDKYLKKHVDKGVSGLLSLTEKWQNAFTKTAFDIFVGDEKEPRLTEAGFKAGEYFSFETKKQIFSYLDIDGAIIDKNGKHIITTEELKTKILHDKDGKQVKPPKLRTALERLGTIAGKALSLDKIYNGGKKLFGKLKSKYKDFSAKSLADQMSKAGMAAVDVYLNGEIVLYAKEFKEGLYLDVKSGKVISNHYQITGPVAKILPNGENEVILTQEEIEKAQFTDSLGKPLEMVKGDFLRANFYKGLNATGKSAFKKSKLGKKLTSWGDTAKEKIFGKKDSKDKDGDGLDDKDEKRKGSWVSKREAKEKDSWIGKLASAIRGDGKDKKGKPNVKKPSWLSKILGGVAKLGGLLLGGLSSLGGLITGGLWGVTKFLIPKVGGLLFKTAGLIAKPLIASIGWLGKKIITAVAGKGFMGNGVGGVGKLVKAAGLAAGGYMMYKGLKGEAKTDENGNPILDANGNPETERDWGGVAAGAATMALSTGTGLKLAGRALVGGFGMARAAVGLLTGPVGLAIGGATLAYMGAKWMYGRYKKGKALEETPMLAFRFNQYGFDITSNEDVFNKIMQLEASLKGSCIIAGDNVNFRSDIDPNAIFGIFGLKFEGGGDTERNKKFLTWFLGRFKPIYLSYVKQASLIKKKTDISTLDKDMTAKEKLQMLDNVHFKSQSDTNPYNVMTTPFEDPEKCNYDFDDVEDVYEKVKDNLKDLADKEVSKTAEGEQGKKDGEKPTEDKKDESALSTAAKAAFKATPLGGIISGTTWALKKLGVDSGKIFTETVSGIGKSMSSLLEQLTSSFTSKWEKLKGLGSSIAQGVSDTASAVGGAVANGVSAVGQAASDTWEGVKSALGGSSKEKFKKIHDAAKKAGDPHPEVVAAQWAIESGWGQKQSGKFNFFGIKAGANEPGTMVPTHEVIGGRRVAVNAKFKDYASLEDGIVGRVNFTKRNSRYTKSGYFAAKTPYQAAQALQRGGYATDPNYANTIAKVISGAGFNPNASSNNTGSGGGGTGTVPPMIAAPAVNATKPATMNAATKPANSGGGTVPPMIAAPANSGGKGVASTGSSSIANNSASTVKSSGGLQAILAKCTSDLVSAGKSFYRLKDSNVTLNGMNTNFMTLFYAMLGEAKSKGCSSVTISEGVRSYQEQVRLWNLYQSGKGGLAARPGTSRHGFGQAMDINSINANELDKKGLLAKYGFVRPLLSKGEPWHLENKWVPKNGAPNPQIGANKDAKGATSAGGNSTGGNTSNTGGNNYGNGGVNTGNNSINGVVNSGGGNYTQSVSSAQQGDSMSIQATLTIMNRQLAVATEMKDAILQIRDKLVGSDNDSLKKSKAPATGEELAGSVTETVAGYLAQKYGLPDPKATAKPSPVISARK